MPLSLTDARVEALIHLLYVQPDGLAAKDMAAHFEPPLPPRSAQRWLAGLVAAGLLARQGKGRATRYLAPTERRGRKPRSSPPTRVSPAATPAVTVPPASSSTPAGRSTPVSSTTAPARVAPPSTSKVPPQVAPTSAGKFPARGKAGSSSHSDAPKPPQAQSPAPKQPEAAPAAPASGLPTVPTLTANRVAELLPPLILDFVAAHMVPERSREEIGLHGRWRLRNGESLDDLICVVTAALDRVTMDDAVRYGIEPAAFMEWREIYWPAMVVAAPPAPSATPLPPLPPTPSISAERARYLFGYVPDLIRDRVTPAMLRAWLTKRAPMAMRGAETLEDWVTLMNAELCRLRLEDAVALNVPPDRYRLWRKTIWPA